MKKYIAIFLSLLLILTVIPVYAEPSIKVECNCDWYDWEYEPNFRTMIVVDVVINENLNELNQADYRPEKDTSWLKDFEFTSLMDMVVYKGFNEGKGLPRENVLKIDEQADDYSLKLQRLIDNNVMSRETFYYCTRLGSGMSISDDRYWEYNKNE